MDLPRQFMQRRLSTMKSSAGTVCPAMGFWPRCTILCPCTMILESFLYDLFSWQNTGQRPGHPLCHVELAYAATKERWYPWCELWARRQRSQTLEPTQGSRLNSRWFERTNLHDPLEFIFLALPFRNSFSSLLGSPNFVILWDGFATDVLVIALQVHPSM